MDRLAAATAALLAAAPLAVAASPTVLAAFDDPAGDATGPGTYALPLDNQFRAGDFDLRRFRVLLDGDDVLFEVTFDATIRRPDTTRRDSDTPIPLGPGLYLQNVDVYVDEDGAPGTGSTACIPGRRVGFAGGRGWESAVVLTPQPGPTREALSDLLGEQAGRVAVPLQLQTTGRTVTARVPAAFFGSPPSARWSYSVQVSGASWERRWHLVDSLRGRAEANVFTLDVRPMPEPFAFGGAPVGDAHPRVLDLLVPPGADQARILSGFDEKAGTFAAVPFVGGAPAPPSAAPAASPATAAAGPGAGRPPTLPVADVADELVTLSGTLPGLGPMRLGAVLDASGAVVARVVVLQVLDGGVLARAVEGKDRIARGLQVRFEAGPAAPSGAGR